MRTLLLVAAFILAFIATWLGFGWFDTTSDQWPGWISASFAVYILAHLVEGFPFHGS